MDKFIELLSNFIQIFMLIYFITKTFGFKSKSNYAKIFFVVTLILTFSELSFINYIVVYDGFLSATIILTLIVYARIFLKGDFFQHIFVVVFSMAIIFTLASVVLFVFSYISKESMQYLISDFSFERIAILIICRCLEVLIFKFMLRLNSQYALSLKEWFLFASLPIFTWISVTLLTQNSLGMQFVQYQMFYIILIMIAINIIIFFFMYKIKRDTQTKIDYELLKMQYNNMKQMETNMKALYESTYSVKHDLEKHFLVLKTYAQDNRYDEMSDYIEKIFDKDISNIQKIVFTDNDVFNAIVNTKLELCRQKNIISIVNISNEAVSYIKITDIAVLFGNIFDNAIEAAERTDDKLIILNVQMQGEYISVYMENSYNEGHSNISLETTKDNKDEHGFGTKNIKKIVSENGGMIQYFKNDEGMFCCDILLKK